jgi:hypothetical protein
LHLWGKCSPTWARPPALFALVILEIGLTFCPGWPGRWAPYFILSEVTGMTGILYYLQLFPTEMESHSFFCPVRLGTSIPPILTSGIAGKTGTWHRIHLLIDMKSWKLPARTGLEPWSSWSQPPKKLGLQGWAIVLAVNIHLIYDVRQRMRWRKMHTKETGWCGEMDTVLEEEKPEKQPPSV